MSEDIITHKRILQQIEQEIFGDAALNDRQRAIIYRYAWDDGHAYGYESVESYYRNFCYFYKELRNCER